MLCEGNLLRYLWTKAVNIVCYILNHVSTIPIIKKTPYEIWNERKPNICYFHIFGCKCFILNNEKDNLGKFDAKSDEGQSASGEFGLEPSVSGLVHWSTHCRVPWMPEQQNSPWLLSRQLVSCG